MRFVRLLLAVLVLAAATVPASAIESVRVPLDSQAIDLTRAVESYSSQGDRLQVSTAPGSDGIVRRIEVRAKQEGARPSWIVFALTNDTDEQIERLLVAPHFRLVGSGVIWPDLGAIRINAITASQGFPPEAEENPDADVFRLTLDPGTTRQAIEAIGRRLALDRDDVPTLRRILRHLTADPAHRLQHAR